MNKKNIFFIKLEYCKKRKNLITFLSKKNLNFYFKKNDNILWI